jgi:hypothetical protein
MIFTHPFGRGRGDPVDGCAKRMIIRDPVDSCAKRMKTARSA